MTSSTNTRIIPLWRQRRYLLWLGSDTGSALGMSLQWFAVPLVALIVTNSPTQAGLITAIGQLGRVVCTMPGGILADSKDRRTLMILGGLLGAVGGVGLMITSLGGHLGFWSLLILHLLMSVRNGLFGSASDAALKDIVPESQLPGALAANQGRDAVISLAGGPLGGLLLSVSQAVTFGALALAHVVAATCAKSLPATAPLSLPAPDRRSSGKSKNGPLGALKESLAEGLSGLTWLLRRRDLRGVLMISTLLNLGINASITSVIFGLQQRGESAGIIGVVSASLGVGMLLGSLPAAALLKWLPTGVAVCVGLLFTAGAMSLMPFTTSVPWICALFGISIIGAPTINAGLGGYLMTAIPSALLGRATSASALLSMAAVPLAPLIAGFGYTAWGWSGLLLFCAGICVFATILAIANWPLRTLPQQQEWSRHAANFDV
ncbi:MFS transporter [Arthrobacter sp. 7749]|nr:MFS transporter [Arthrobacter sp. 7749]